METNVKKVLAELQAMSVSQLRQRYEEVFGETTNAPQQTMAAQEDYLAAAVSGRR